MSRDEYIGHVLKGNVAEALNFGETITMEEILEPMDGGEELKLVLIEGAPGIGKSTLAWELCRNWDKFPCMKQYILVVLLRLRERRVQNVENLLDFFFSYEIPDQKPVVDELVRCHGKGVLFVLDGFDELPTSLQHEGLLVEVIQKRVFPKSTVIVTSRPSAMAELLNICSPLIQRRIEILGFTQDSIKAYTSSIIPSDSEALKKFESYISFSENSAINSLMYVPINAAIIVQIFLENMHKGSLLPRNLTQLYTQLCLTILNRYTRVNCSSVTVHKLENLPHDLYANFLDLAKIAFKCVMNQEVIFHSDTVPSDFNHFGFLDAFPALYGGDDVSYNFLHLTLQEFFAAYYISQNPGCLKEYYTYDRQWNVVWRFVAGLTNFSYANSSFTELSLFFVQCLFEAQITIDFKSMFGCEMCSCRLFQEEPLDYYALGYCIANCTTEKSLWVVACECDQVRYDAFIHGLTSSISSTVGVILKLSLITSPYTCPISPLFPSPAKPLYNNIVELILQNALLNMVDFSEGILRFSSLKVLSIEGSELDSASSVNKFLMQLYKSDVISLNIVDTGFEKFLYHTPSVVSVFGNLIHKLSGKLKELVTGSYTASIEEIQGLVGIVSSDSSLQHLSLKYPYGDMLPCFNHNNQLQELTLIGDLGDTVFTRDDKVLIPRFVNTLQDNTTLQQLRFKYFVTGDESVMKNIVIALRDNRSVEVLTLYGRFNSHTCAEITMVVSAIDPRVEVVMARKLDLSGDREAELSCRIITEGDKKFVFQSAYVPKKIKSRRF